MKKDDAITVKNRDKNITFDNVYIGTLDLGKKEKVISYNIVA